MFKNKTFLALFCCLVGWTAISHAQSIAVSSKTAWRLIDIDGVEHKPFDDELTRGIVLVFISTDCPIANSYHPLLRRFAESYERDGIRFFMIHPEPKTTVDEARKHSVQFEIQVPVVIDKDQAISRQVGATVTPQVFVMVRGQESPAYQGRIDDLYVDFGKKRIAATTHDLEDAIKAIVAGKSIAQQETKPIGCFISFVEVPQEALPTKKSDYDPLSVDRDEVKRIELTVVDQDRAREIPLLVYLPKHSEPAAVILHSHGLGDPKKAFANVRVPWMCLTGTNDTSPIGNADVDSRLAVYSALPDGNKYELVLDGAEHSVFTERALQGENQSRNPNHHRAILAVTTAFWDTFLRDDPDAKTWLNGSDVRTVLDPKDRWQKK